MTIALSAIYRYPVKSLPGISLNSTLVENYGLNSDRCMMLVDENGVFISQRKFPELALIKVSIESNQVVLENRNKSTIVIDTNSFLESKLSVDVWGDRCSGLIATEVINKWFSELLQRKVFLVKYDFDNPRATDPLYSQESDVVSFADGFPILMISESSLMDLNERLDEPVSMLNFRPNLVVKGCEPFSEDSWKAVKIGPVEFDLVKQCSRCVLTTINPKTGEKHEKGQPLKTLSTYRRNKLGVVFGMNLIPRTLGEVAVGNIVKVIR